MNLYLIERVGECGYDEYDSAVVCAESEGDARMIHPAGCEWDGKDGAWGDSWVNAKSVKVTMIGTASDGIQPGTVVCSSFNAG